MQLSISQLILSATSKQIKADDAFPFWETNKLFSLSVLNADFNKYVEEIVQ